MLKGLLDKIVWEMKFGGMKGRDFYLIVLACVFSDFGSFEVRYDIDIPRKPFEDGVVLVFDEGRVAYFKTQENDMSDDEFEFILNVCYLLQDSYGCRVDAYVLCYPNVELRQYDNIEREDILIHLASLRSCNGDAVLDDLIKKCEEGCEFTFEDHVNHILLPYMNCNDDLEFKSRLSDYYADRAVINSRKKGINVRRVG